MASTKTKKLDASQTTLSEAERRELRAARFAADAKKPPPPLPVRKYAWAGGAITSNKDEARRKFLERKAKQQQDQIVETDVAENTTDVTTKLFVGGLSFKTTTRGLAAFFDGCSHAAVIRDAGGRSKGFGFVTFPDAATASKALALDGRTLDGRGIAVKPARAENKTKARGGSASGWGGEGWAMPTDANAAATSSSTKPDVNGKETKPKKTKDRRKDEWERLNAEKPLEAPRVEPGVPLW